MKKRTGFGRSLYIDDDAVVAGSLGLERRYIEGSRSYCGV